MKNMLMIYDSEKLAFKKGDADYEEQLRAWAEATARSEKEHWEALCEVLYAAHYKLMETCGGYAVDHTQEQRLDSSIETILEAMPSHAKEHFDKLMLRPCAS